MKGLSFLIFFVILSLGIFLRSYRIEYKTTYLADQGRDSLVIWQILKENKLTLLGPPTSEGGFFHGPIFYYLILPFYPLFSFDPIASSWAMVFCSALTIILLFFIVQKYLGEKTAQITATLYAFSPLMVDCGRSALNPYLIPFFETILLGAIFCFLNSRGTIAPVVAGLASGILVQLHYFILPLILVVLFIFISVRFGLNLSSFLLGFFLGISPFLTFELRHGFFNTNQAFNFLVSLLRTKKAGSILHFADFVNFFKLLFGNSIALSTLFFIFFFIGLIYSFQRGKLSKSISLLFLLNLLFLLFLPVKFSPHYFLSLALLIFITIGSGIASMLPNVSLLIILIIGASLFPTLRFDEETGFNMPAGWNLRMVKRTSQIIANDIGKKSFNIAAILDGDTRAIPYRYVLKTLERNPLGVEKYPETDTLYLIARKDQEPVFEYKVWEIESLLPAKITKEWKIKDNFYIYKIERQKNSTRF